MIVLQQFREGWIIFNNGNGMLDAVKGCKTLFVDLDIQAVNSKNQTFSRRSILYNLTQLIINSYLILLLKSCRFLFIQITVDCLVMQL